MGERTGERFASGQLLELRLAEANPLTGALKFEPVEMVAGVGRVERRGGKPPMGKRGRPGNIRHQGKRR